MDQPAGFVHDYMYLLSQTAEKQAKDDEDARREAESRGHR